MRFISNLLFDIQPLDLQGSYFGLSGDLTSDSEAACLPSTQVLSQAN